MKKNPTSFRLSDEAVRLLARIAADLGVTQSAATEVIIREAAKKRKVA